MTLDEQLRHTFDALSERLRGEIAAHLELATKEMIAAADAERARVSEQIARDVRAEAEREISVRLRTITNDETIVSTKSVPVRQLVGSRGGAAVHTLLGTQTARVLTTDEDPGETALLDSVESDLSREPGLEGDQSGAKDPAHVDTARLLDSMHALDQSRSLSRILDTLVAEAGKEAPRAGIFLASGSPLRSWRCTGFELTVDEAKPFELPLDEAGVIFDAIRLGSTAFSNGTPSSAPSFAQLPRPCDAMAVPVALAGQVVAVLYADSGQNGSLSPVRRATLEILTRYAARSIEVITAFRVAQMLTGSPSRFADAVRAESSR